MVKKKKFNRIPFAYLILKVLLVQFKTTAIEPSLAGFSFLLLCFSGYF